MKEILCGIVVVCGLLGMWAAGIARANNGVGDETMMASPSVIVLDKVSTVTVHTSIPLSTVAPGSVSLDGAAPTLVKADSLGHLVAKFAVDDLDLSPGKATLTLAGLYIDGSEFSATDEVMVK